MAHDWQVGDLAVCVDAGPDCDGLPVPFEDGRSYLVASIHIDKPMRSKFGSSEVGLNFCGVEHWWCGYASERFRKIRPDQQSGEIEDWNLLLETTKRKVQA